MSEPRLTPTQKRGLLLLDRKPKGARYSNSTDANVPSLYWQTADRLVELGLATSDRHHVEITDAGRELAASLA